MKDDWALRYYFEKKAASAYLDESFSEVEPEEI